MRLARYEHVYHKSPLIKLRIKGNQQIKVKVNLLLSLLHVYSKLVIVTVLAIN